MNRICKIKRHTVRIKGCQYKARHIGYHSVYIRVRTGLCDSVSPVLSGYHTDIGSVGLIRGYNVLRRKAQGSRNPVIVFPHSLLLIASCKAQIHRRINPLTDSSKPGAEPVYKTRNFFKLRPGKISHSLIFSDIHMRHVFLMP